MGLFQTNQAIKFCAIMATVMGVGPVAFAQEVDPFTEERDIYSVHAKQPGALWSKAKLKVTYTPKTETSPGRFQVTLSEPKSDGSISVEVGTEKLNTKDLRKSFIQAVTESRYKDDVKNILRLVYDEVMSPSANPIDPTIAAVPRFLTEVKDLAKGKDEMVDSALNIKNNERQLSISKKDFNAHSATFGVADIYCCGDPALTKKLSKYGAEGKSFCPTEPVPFLEVGFDYSKLDKAREPNATMGCKDGTVFCVTESAKCAYIYSDEDAVIPFTGKMACAVKSTAGCTPALASECGRDNLSVRQGKKGIRESLGRFDTKGQTLIPSGRAN